MRRGGERGAGADQHGRDQDAADRWDHGGGEHSQCGQADTGCHAQLVGQFPGVPGPSGEGLDRDCGEREEGDRGAGGHWGHPCVGPDNGEEPDTGGQCSGRGGQREGGPQEVRRPEPPGQVEHGLPLAGQRRHRWYRCGSPPGDQQGQAGQDAAVVGISGLRFSCTRASAYS